MKSKSMEIYVTVFKYGNYDDQHTDTFYVGTDFDKANEICIKYKDLSKTYSQCFGYIQTWVNGEMVNEKEFDF
jgi:hypothetical protein